MGAWGVKPMENDGAWDWFGEHVEPHLVEAIETALWAYLDSTNPVAEEDQAQAAAALLFDCTSKTTQTKYRTITLRYEAKVRGLWDAAIDAVNKMMNDDLNLSRWNDRAAKVAALQELKADLEQVREENKDLKA